MQWNFQDNVRTRTASARRVRSEVHASDTTVHGFETEPGSDFLIADGGDPSAEALERGLRREERRHAERRKAIGVFVALAVAGTVLLGGAFAALAASHGPSSQATASAAMAPAQVTKHKKHKAKTKRSAKAAGQTRKSASAGSAAN